MDAQLTAPAREPLLTVPEAARWLRVCVRTLSTLRKRGDIAAVPIGSRVFYDPRDLAAYIEKQKAAATSSATARIANGGRQ